MSIAILIIIAVYYLYKYFFKKPEPEYPTQKIINDYVNINTNESFENQEKPVHEIDIHNGNPYFIIGINGYNIFFKYPFFKDIILRTIEDITINKNFFFFILIFTSLL